MRQKIGILMMVAFLITACQPLAPAVVFGSDYSPMRVSVPDCAYGGKLKSIQAVSRYSVRFELCSPDPAFLSKVAFGAFAIQDSDFLNTDKGDSFELSKISNGTGPYQVKTYTRGQSLVLMRNPKYWGTPAKSSEVTFLWGNTNEDRLQTLRSGTANGMDAPDAQDVQAILENSKLQYFQRPGLSTFYLGMNNSYPPFDRINVRKAIAMAVDRKKIVSDIFPLGTVVAEQLVPPTISPGSSSSISWYPTDIDKARELLKSGVYDYSMAKITLSYANLSQPYMPNPRKIAQAVKQDIEKTGMQVALKEMSPAAFVDAVTSGNEGFFMLGWNGTYPDGANFFESHFNGVIKNFGEPNSELLSAIRAGGSASQILERQKYYDKANLIIKETVPLIPVAHAASGVVFSAGVMNTVIGPLNENFEEMSTINDRLTFTQKREPESLWPGDEIQADTLRPASLLYDTLLRYKFGETGVEPSLAETWEVNADATVWTFNLRRGVKFSNSALFDANDVVATFAAQWDASNPNHTGRTGTFEAFISFFGEFINK